jgi:hypothetical protein
MDVATILKQARVLLKLRTAKTRKEGVTLSAEEAATLYDMITSIAAEALKRVQ